MIRGKRGCYYLCGVEDGTDSFVYVIGLKLENFGKLWMLFIHKSRK